MTEFLTLLLFFNFIRLSGQHTASPPLDGAIGKPISAILSDQHSASPPSGQGGSPVNAIPGPGVPPVKIRPIVLDLCNETKHVYFKVSFNGELMRQSSVKQMMFTLRKAGITYASRTVTLDYGYSTSGEEGQTGGTTLKRDTFPWSTGYADYIDLEFYNIVNVDDDIEMVIKYYDHLSVFISEVNFGIPLTKDESIVDVTDHMGAWIDAYMDKGFVAGGLMTWFCDKEISQIELVAFFKDYFGWSEEQICNFVRQFNIFSSFSSSTVNVNGTHYAILCTILDDWQRKIIGGGGEEEDEEECHCKLIRTDSDAGLVGYYKLTVSDGCKNYDQKLYEKHYLSGSWEGSDDDDLLLLSGRMGAAKGEIFYA